MVVHIVLIKFKETEEKAARIAQVKEAIEGLMGRVPSLRSMETGVNFSPEDRAMDLGLIATFDDREGLERYARHPEHLKVIEQIKEGAEYSKVVDYETL